MAFNIATNQQFDGLLKTNYATRKLWAKSKTHCNFPPTIRWMMFNQKHARRCRLDFDEHPFSGSVEKIKYKSQSVRKYKWKAQSKHMNTEQSETPSTLPYMEKLNKWTIEFTIHIDPLSFCCCTQPSNQILFTFYNIYTAFNFRKRYFLAKHFHFHFILVTQPKFRHSTVIIIAFTHSGWHNWGDEDGQTKTAAIIILVKRVLHIQISIS